MQLGVSTGCKKKVSQKDDNLEGGENSKCRVQGWLKVIKWAKKLIFYLDYFVSSSSFMGLPNQVWTTFLWQKASFQSFLWSPLFRPILPFSSVSHKFGRPSNFSSYDLKTIEICVRLEVPGWSSWGFLSSCIITSSSAFSTPLSYSIIQISYNADYSTTFFFLLVSDSSLWKKMLM